MIPVMTELRQLLLAMVILSNFSYLVNMLTLTFYACLAFQGRRFRLSRCGRITLHEAPPENLQCIWLIRAYFLYSSRSILVMHCNMFSPLLLFSYICLTLASPARLVSSKDSERWLARRQSTSGYPANTIDMPVCQINCSILSKAYFFIVDWSFPW